VDHNTVRKYVALAISLGYRPREARLSTQEWAAIVAQHAPSLADPAQRSVVFAEISRYHEAIVAGLETNTVTTVWQRFHDEQGLQVSLRSFRRYVEHYLPERSKQAQPTVLRDDPPPGQEAQIDFGYLGLWHDAELAKRASSGPSPWS